MTTKTEIQEVSKLLYVWVHSPAVAYMSEETTIAFAKATAEAEGYVVMEEVPADTVQPRPETARVTFYGYTK